MLLYDDFTLLHPHGSTDDVVASCLDVGEFIDDWFIFDDTIDVRIEFWDGETYHTSFSVVAWGDDKFVVASCFEGDDFRDEIESVMSYVYSFVISGSLCDSIWSL